MWLFDWSKPICFAMNVTPIQSQKSTTTLKKLAVWRNYWSLHWTNHYTRSIGWTGLREGLIAVLLGAIAPQCAIPIPLADTGMLAVTVCEPWSLHSTFIGGDRLCVHCSSGERMCPTWAVTNYSQYSLHQSISVLWISRCATQYTLFETMDAFILKKLSIVTVESSPEVT